MALFESGIVGSRQSPSAKIGGAQVDVVPVVGRRSPLPLHVLPATETVALQSAWSNNTDFITTRKFTCEVEKTTIPVEAQISGKMTFGEAASIFLE